MAKQRTQNKKRVNGSRKAVDAGKTRVRLDVSTLLKAQICRAAELAEKSQAGVAAFILEREVPRYIEEVVRARRDAGQSVAA